MCIYTHQLENSNTVHIYTNPHLTKGQTMKHCVESSPKMESFNLFSHFHDYFFFLDEKNELRNRKKKQPLKKEPFVIISRCR